jgi:hypothetical protein
VRDATKVDPTEAPVVSTVAPSLLESAIGENELVGELVVVENNVLGCVVVEDKMLDSEDEDVVDIAAHSGISIVGMQNLLVALKAYPIGQCLTSVGRLSPLHLINLVEHGWSGSG